MLLPSCSRFLFFYSVRIFFRLFRFWFRFFIMSMRATAFWFRFWFRFRLRFRFRFVVRGFAATRFFLMKFLVSSAIFVEVSSLDVTRFNTLEIRFSIEDFSSFVPLFYNLRNRLRFRFWYWQVLVFQIIIFHNFFQMLFQVLYV